MGNLTKNQQIREKMKADVHKSKQSTIDNIAYQFNIPKTIEADKPTKTIIISDIVNTTGEDELALKIGFSLFPSKAAFSKINMDLYFQEELLKSTPLSIPQTPLLSDSLEHHQTLGMKGIGAGSYLIRVEMYEPWSSGEKLNFTAKETTVQYVPHTRTERLVKIPTVKSVAGEGLIVVSPVAKKIYHDIDQDLKEESVSKRDDW